MTHNQHVINFARALSGRLNLMNQRADEIIKRMEAIEALPDWRAQAREWNELEHQLKLLRAEIREMGHSY